MLPLAREPSRPEEGLTRVKEHLVAVADFFVRPAHLGLTPVESVDLETLEAAQVSGCGENVRQWVGSTGRIPPHPIPCPSSPVHPLPGALFAKPRVSSTDTRDAQSARSSLVMTLCFLAPPLAGSVLLGSFVTPLVPCP